MMATHSNTFTSQVVSSISVVTEYIIKVLISVHFYFLVCVDLAKFLPCMSHGHVGFQACLRLTTSCLHHVLSSLTAHLPSPPCQFECSCLCPTSTMSSQSQSLVSLCLSRLGQLWNYLWNVRRLVSDRTWLQRLGEERCTLVKSLSWILEHRDNSEIRLNVTQQ